MRVRIVFYINFIYKAKDYTRAKMRTKEKLLLIKKLCVYIIPHIYTRARGSASANIKEREKEWRAG